MGTTSGWRIRLSASASAWAAGTEISKPSSPVYPDRETRQSIPSIGGGGDAHERQGGGVRRQARHDGDGLGALQGQQRSVVQLSKPDGFAQIGREVGEVDVLAAGVDDQEQAVFIQAGDHQVVDDASGLVGEQRVALAAGFQAGDIAGDQPFERCCHVGSGERGLAHVRDVEQPGVSAGMKMLRENASFAAGGEVAGQIVLHRHGIARERHHAGAVAAVPGVERGRLQRRGGGVVWQSVLNHTFLREQGHPPAGCRQR